MAELNPFSSVFTTAGMKLLEGAKVTIQYLNRLVDNTGFNWMGGRYPMRESFGIVTLTNEDVQPDETAVVYSHIDVDVNISTRVEGVRHFSTSNSYNVYLTLMTTRSIQYSQVNTMFAMSPPTDIYPLEDSLGIDRMPAPNTSPIEWITGLGSVDLVSQTRDSFRIRIDFPRNRSVVSVGWIARGW